MEKFDKIIVANWKMKLDLKESLVLANDLLKILEKIDIGNKKIAICPSFLAIPEVALAVKDSSIALGAQDTFYQEEGTFTGEVSPENLKEIGCQYVIVGHSERRAMGEDDDLVNRKALAVLKEEMVPIICVGEKMEERDRGESENVVLRQLEIATRSIAKDDYFIVAYEPVWSISTSGSGKVINSQQATEMINIIYKNLSQKFSNFVLFYGGSVDEVSVAEFCSLENVGGVLVGAASLNAKKFIELVKNS